MAKLLHPLPGLMVIVFLISLPNISMAQQVQENQHLVVAGKEYDKPGFYQWLWGKHYRRDWIKPVKVNTIKLDTVNGGLVAYEAGGGRQTKTLRLRNPEGKEYVLRSINKSFGKALPDLYRGTWIERVMNDQVSIAEPYSAITISPMAEAAGIYHTNPVIVYVPAQDALAGFNEKYGNDLYLFEQRPDENWKEADNFGNSKKIISTEKMLEKILADNENRVDQRMFVKARLFDMFIGDWGRHEDQWRWASFENDDKTIYRPIPRDRDQAYTLFDGFLLSKLSSSIAGHLQSFGNDIKDVSEYNFPARNLDRQMTNEVPKEDWIKAANELKAALTDQVIEQSVRLLPSELGNQSINQIISKLKSRREKLPEFARDYYAFLSKEVEITGTKTGELFKITLLPGNETQVGIYDFDKDGKPAKDPFYTRKFKPAETNEIRLYGIGGFDQYILEGNQTGGTRIRIIGGPDYDTYFSNDETGIHIYDNKENDFSKFTGGRKHLTENPFVHYYNYKWFEYDKKGLGPVISYSSEDHIHIGIKYEAEKKQWRKQPFGYHQELAARYSISEAAFSFGYEGQFTKLVGNWNLHLGAEYDLVRWNNFYGIGNESVMLTDDRNFHRVRTKELFAGIGLDRNFANYHHTGFTLYYQTIQLIQDPGRFASKPLPNLNNYELKPYAGARAEYYYQKVDNAAVPTKGFRFGTDLDFSHNLKHSDSSVFNMNAVMNIYVPLSKSFVFSLKTGGGKLFGQPAFYQLNKLSGTKTLRGFRKYRFYGESMFYNQAELQFIPFIKTSLFNGRAGLIGFYDIGRVWHPGENSDTWHSSYGGGIMIAPFNKVSVAVFYGISQHEDDFGIRFLKAL